MSSWYNNTHLTQSRMTDHWVRIPRDISRRAGQIRLGQPILTCLTERSERYEGEDAPKAAGNQTWLEVATIPLIA
jgi:hypothetical protein